MRYAQLKKPTLVCVYMHEWSRLLGENTPPNLHVAFRHSESAQRRRDLAAYVPAPPTAASTIGTVWPRVLFSSVGILTASGVDAKWDDSARQVELCFLSSFKC